MDDPDHAVLWQGERVVTDVGERPALGDLKGRNEVHRVVATPEQTPDQVSQQGVPEEELAQLQQVLRKVLARCRAGVVQVGDLPGDTFATVRRVLTLLEAIECDAIVDALIQADGSKARAAQRLGMSRATIYRKIRDLGISLPT